MPSIRIVDDNSIEFVDSNGDVQAREEYDEGASRLSFVDGDGNPMPVSFGDAEGESISIGSLTDTQDGQAWETLQEAGYETGDVIPVTSIGNDSFSTVSSSSSSFTNATSLFGSNLKWDEIVPSTVQPKVRIDADLSPGSGETASIRAHLLDAGETAVTLSTDTGGRVSTGWVDFVPTSPSQVDLFFSQVRSQPGSNTSDFKAAQFAIGVEI